MHDLIEPERAAWKPERPFDRWNKLGSIALLGMILAILGMALAGFDLTELRAWMAANRDLSLLTSLLVLTAASLAMVPTIPITLLLAVLIGPWQAMIVTALGNTFSALLHYQMGKQVGGMVRFEEMKARLPFKLGELPVHSPLFLLIGRALPGGPKWLSFVCGTYQVPLLRYSWTTLFTNLCGAALVAFGGDQLNLL